MTHTQQHSHTTTHPDTRTQTHAPRHTHQDTRSRHTLPDTHTHRHTDFPPLSVACTLGCLTTESSATKLDAVQHYLVSHALLNICVNLDLSATHCNYIYLQHTATHCNTLTTLSRITCAPQCLCASRSICNTPQL